MNKTRRDGWAMSLAMITAKQATCSRKQVGCIVLSTDGHVIGSGYNGTPRGVEHCFHPPGNSDPCSKAVHAEVNALCGMLRHGGSSTLKATAYVTLSPCLACSHLLIAAGVSRVVWTDDYRDLSGVEWLASLPGSFREDDRLGGLLKSIRIETFESL